MDFITKFRAFQLDSEGSLFSFYKQNQYVLIEARLPKDGINELKRDLKLHNKERLDVLHITSWDADHCTYNDLIPTLNQLRPDRIEIPSYEPESEDGKLCKTTILGYDIVHEKYKPNVHIISREYIASLPTAQAKETDNVIYPSKYDADKKNDMSLIKLFRSAGFNVLSLGDCECCSIADRLGKDSFITTEVDVLILPHHGADNGFISLDLLQKIKPKLAVCSSNYGNQYDHPRQEIRDMLCAKNIPLYTTKRGDAIVFQRPNTTEAIAINFITGNQDNENPVRFTPRRFA